MKSQTIDSIVPRVKAVSRCERETPASQLMSDGGDVRTCEPVEGAMVRAES